jgi:uncharacterized protein
MTHDFRTRPLSAAEARVLATLMEKARTVPDSYPLTLNSLQSGCNQKSSREPVMNLSEAEIAQAIDGCASYSLVFESSGGRVPATNTTSSAPSACPSSRPCCWAC